MINLDNLQVLMRIPTNNQMARIYKSELPEWPIYHILWQQIEAVNTFVNDFSIWRLDFSSSDNGNLVASTRRL